MEEGQYHEGNNGVYLQGNAFSASFQSKLSAKINSQWQILQQ